MNFRAKNKKSISPKESAGEKRKKRSKSDGCITDVVETTRLGKEKEKQERVEQYASIGFPKFKKTKTKKVHTSHPPKDFIKTTRGMTSANASLFVRKLETHEEKHACVVLRVAVVLVAY